jgi:membrane protein implicated in regulation of membrane protease activity
VWALMLSIFFSMFSGRNWPREGAGWGGALFFFLIVWLATWGVGAWVTPVGPVLWGVPWLGFLFLAVIVALLLSASSPPRRPRTLTQAIVQQSEQAQEERIAVAIFSVYFWILLGVLIAVLVARYGGWHWQHHF